MTPEGIKREKDVDRSQSITSQTGRKLDFIIIGVLVLAVGYLLFDKLAGTESAKPVSEDLAQAATRDGRHREATRDVLREYGGLWFVNETFAVQRRPGKGST